MVRNQLKISLPHGIMLSSLLPRSFLSVPKNEGKGENANGTNFMFHEDRPSKISFQLLRYPWDESASSGKPAFPRHVIRLIIFGLS
jgi:hypothetical protein